MSSPFDFDTTTEPKAKKAPKPTIAETGNKLKDALRQSKSETESTKVEGEAATPEPKISTQIHQALAQIINKQHIIKRSQAVSRVVKELFTDLDDATDAEANSIYGSVNLTIEQMVSEGDAQELKFHTDEGRVVDSVLFSANLNVEGLESDSSIELDLPDVGVAEGLAADLAEVDDDELNDVGDVHSVHDHDLLAQHIEGFMVAFDEGDHNRVMKPVDNAAGALSLYARLSEQQGANAQIYGMVPIQVETRLAFDTMISDDIVPPAMAEVKAPEAAIDLPPETETPSAPATEATPQA